MGIVLCFFDRPENITLNIDQKEYLLVKSFHIVFEAIIDELIAGDQRKQLPKELKDQPDGKRVDHMYQYKELTNNEMMIISIISEIPSTINEATPSVWKVFTSSLLMHAM